MRKDYKSEKKREKTIQSPFEEARAAIATAITKPANVVLEEWEMR